MCQWNGCRYQVMWNVFLIRPKPKSSPPPRVGPRGLSWDISARSVPRFQRCWNLSSHRCCAVMVTDLSSSWDEEAWSFDLGSSRSTLVLTIKFMPPEKSAHRSSPAGYGNV